ncbi:von willebrand factor type A domain protein, partial (macronuclear) [Tetrahymena thermophila SB210]
MPAFSINAKESIQICFLVDATGSMQRYVDKVRQEIEKICKSIKQVQQTDLKIYVSMVAYRDRTDDKSVEKIDFTDNLDQFQQFIKQLNYKGGDDQCEDVQIGLQEVIKLQWKQSSLNLLVWIADAPCHGQEFHDDNANDHFPEDDGEELKKLLKQICDLNVD